MTTASNKNKNEVGENVWLFDKCLWCYSRPCPSPCCFEYKLLGTSADFCYLITAYPNANNVYCFGCQYFCSHSRCAILACMLGVGAAKLMCDRELNYNQEICGVAKGTFELLGSLCFPKDKVMCLFGDGWSGRCITKRNRTRFV